MKYALGIDIGGTNIKALALTAKGRLLARTVVPTGGGSRAEWTTNVRQAMTEIQSKLRTAPECIGVAAPGLAAKDQRSISHMPGRLPGLERLDWQEFFRHPRPVPVLNDAHAALLGEVWRGAARGAQNVILLTLGTGVGGAALVDGRLLRGHLGRAGHLGHISVDPAGKPDIVGTPGSLENALGDCTLKKRSGGRFVSTSELLAAVENGDTQARRVWTNSLQALAVSINSFINLFDPELVVIGGGIANAGGLLFPSLRKAVRQMEWRPGGARVRIVSAELGDRAGAYGAAWQSLQVCR
jgi:glucokinase